MSFNPNETKEPEPESNEEEEGQITIGVDYILWLERKVVQLESDLAEVREITQDVVKLKRMVDEIIAILSSAQHIE